MIIINGAEYHESMLWVRPLYDVIIICHRAFLSLDFSSLLFPNINITIINV